MRGLLNRKNGIFISGKWTDFVAITKTMPAVMRAIASWEEVPLFDSEEAEASFWAEAKPDLRLMEAALAGGTARRRNR